jgi:hypothetical protein
VIAHPIQQLLFNLLYTYIASVKISGQLTLVEERCLSKLGIVLFFSPTRWPLTRAGWGVWNVFWKWERGDLRFAPVSAIFKKQE